MTDQLGTHACRNFKGQKFLKVLVYFMLIFSKVVQLLEDLFHFKDLSEFPALLTNIWIYLLFTKNLANFSIKWAQTSDI